MAFELALAEGDSAEEAEAAADEAFDAAFEEGSIDSLIETAAGGDDFGAPGDDFGGAAESVFSVDAGGPGLGGGLSFDTGFVPGAGAVTGPATVTASDDRNDEVIAEIVDPRILGGEGDDILVGTAGADVIEAGGGDDTIIGVEGDDIIDGGTGDDTISGAGGDDTIIGGEGSDTVSFEEDTAGVQVDLGAGTATGAGTGTDTITEVENVAGGAGDDIIVGDEFDNVLEGGAGNDTITAGDGNDTLVGGEGNDFLYAGDGDDTVDAGAGDDTIVAGAGGGDDTYIGGEGNDTITYTSTSEGITVDLAAGTATGVEIDSDTLSGIENVVGGDGDDTIIGDSSANVLEGGLGDDTIAGGAGDTLDGGDGTDTLRVQVSSAEFDDPSFQADIAAFLALEPGASFTFESIGLNVSNFEDFEVEVDGQIITAQAPDLTIAPSAGGEDTAISLNISAGLGDTEGNETLSDVTISGVPDGATLSAGSFDSATGDWTMSAADLATVTLTPPQDFSGGIALTMSATSTEVDGSTATSSSSFIVAVSGVADDPSLTVSDASGAEDGAIPFDITAGISDLDGSEQLSVVTISGIPDGATISGTNFTFTAGGENGANTLVLAPEQLTDLTITPPADFNGEFSMQVTAVATEEGTSAQTISNFIVTVDPVNDAPVAIGAVTTTDEDTAVTGQLSATDVDSSGGLNYGLADGGAPSQGTVVVNIDGSYTYTLGDGVQSLAAGATLTDTFTYEVTDEAGAVSTATVTITIVGTNDGPVATADTVVGSEDNLVLTGSLVATDVDDPETLSYEVADGGAPTSGAVNINLNGTYSYQLSDSAQSLAAGDTLTDTFTYEVTDSQGAASTATITITIVGTNDGPVATADAISGTEDNLVLTGSLVATDVDIPETLSFSVADGGAPTSGTVTVNPDGTYTYQLSDSAQSLSAGETLTDTFTYEVADSQGAVSTATITITIVGTNDGPVATADMVSGTEDAGVLTGTLVATDADASDTLTFSLAEGGEPTSGSVVVNADGTYTYTLGDTQSLAEGETLADTFTYSVDDGQGGTSTATVTITIIGTNDGPVATAGTLTGSEDSTVLTGSLVASDADATDTLTYSLAEGGEATSGTVVVNADGTYSYTVGDAAQSLGDGETLTDTFTYDVTDSQGEVSTATITITIVGTNDGPVATEGTLSGSEDTGVLTGSLAATDADSGDTMTFSLAEAGDPEFGTVTINADGTFSYMPSAEMQALAVGDTQIDTFTYQVSDGAGGTDTATVTVTITGSNDGPVAVADSGTTAEDAAITIDVLANDFDVDSGSSFEVTSFDGTSASGASVTQNPDGTFSYDPSGSEALTALDDGETATDTFTYTITDEHGASRTATVTVLVTGTGGSDIPVGATLVGTESDDVLVGTGGDDNIAGLGGDDILIGDGPPPFEDFVNAQDIPRSAFGIAPSSDVGDDGLPRVVIDGEHDRNNDIDFFKFEMKAGEKLILDIDYARNQGDSFDPMLWLYNGDGNQVAQNDDSSTRSGGGGSVHGYDSYIEYTVTADGVYYAAVTGYYQNPLDSGDSSGYSSGDYILNTSIEPTEDSTGFGDTPQTIVAVEHGTDLNVLGSAGGDDVLDGGSGDDLLLGGAGDDDLSGGTGDDILSAGIGSDTLDGGAGGRYLDSRHQPVHRRRHLCHGFRAATASASSRWMARPARSSPERRLAMRPGDGGPISGGAASKPTATAISTSPTAIPIQSSSNRRTAAPFAWSPTAKQSAKRQATAAPIQKVSPSDRTERSMSATTTATRLSALTRQAGRCPWWSTAPIS